ncbi:MAG: hypothetical protein Q9183_003943 [Haloplaca sp. 2 TL-2023]
MTPYHFYAKDTDVRNCFYSHSADPDTTHYYLLTAIMSGESSEHTTQKDESSQQAMDPPTPSPSQIPLANPTAQRGLPAHQGLGRGRGDSQQAMGPPTLPSPTPIRYANSTAQRGLPAHQGLGRGRSNSQQAMGPPTLPSPSQIRHANSTAQRGLPVYQGHGRGRGDSQQAMGPPILLLPIHLPTATAQRGLLAHQGRGRGRTDSRQAMGPPSLPLPNHLPTLSAQRGLPAHQGRGRGLSRPRTECLFTPYYSGRTNSTGLSVPSRETFRSTLQPNLGVLPTGRRVGETLSNPILIDAPSGNRVGETPEDPILIEESPGDMPPAPAPNSSVPPPVPPSVEAAYKKKCIQLRKRMEGIDQVQEANLKGKVMRDRGIKKLRLQRALLLQSLGTIMKKNGDSIEGLPVDEDEDSEGSSEGPPTPHEKPLRSKRSHRRPMNASPPPALHPASSSFAATPRGFQQQQQQGYESTFSANPAYHPQQISPSQAPGYFNPPLPGQHDAFPRFLESFLANNPHLHSLPENRQVNLANEAWGRMSEAQRRQRQSGYVVDEERYNRVETQLAALRRGAGLETEEAATADTAADTTNDHAGDEVKDEGGDEDTEEGKGGFTAVND